MQIDFYTGCSHKLRTACQLSLKAMNNGLRTVISVPDAQTASELDLLLWDFVQTSFVPHCRHDAADAANTPVVIHWGDNTQFPYLDVLISLHDEIPPFFAQFTRMLEIISQNDEDSQRGRQRFKYYREQGHTLRHFDLSKG